MWVEFEGGDPDYPIWTGCFWGDGEAPAIRDRPETKIIKTDTATIKLDDYPEDKGITIETKSGLKIVMNSSGIEIRNEIANVKVTKEKVSINNGALDVS